MLRELFFELVEDLELVKSPEEGALALQKLAVDYGLSNVAYLGVNIPTLADSRPYLLTTYSDQWCRHYVAQNYVSLDPVVKHGLSGLLPLDWATVRDKDDKIRRFFGEASEHGVGQQGLSFPIRGAHGETALFSINSHATDAEWTKIKRECMRDFQIFAYHFHTKVLESEGVPVPHVSLSARERECLKWSAAGKTRWEIGEILGISDNTVRFHLELARTKLSTVNTTQTVAKAVRLQLI